MGLSFRLGILKRVGRAVYNSLHSADPGSVFGVELEFLLRREAGSDHIQPGTVPLIIEQCMSEIERRGLTEVGICMCADLIHFGNETYKDAQTVLLVRLRRSTPSKMHITVESIPLRKLLIFTRFAIL